MTCLSKNLPFQNTINMNQNQNSKIQVQSLSQIVEDEKQTSIRVLYQEKDKKDVELVLTPKIARQLQIQLNLMLNEH